MLAILEEELEPIRQRRKYYEARIEEVYNYLKNGTNKANEYANKTLNEVKMAMGINYFNDDNFIKEQINKYN